MDSRSPSAKSDQPFRPEPVSSVTEAPSAGGVDQHLAEAEAALTAASSYDELGAESDGSEQVSTGNSHPRFRWSLPAVGLALFASGAAGLVNQVVWQRSLKIFLGGSESISAMIVVLVFMGGLGFGSLLASSWARRTRRPGRALGGVEFLLAVVNLAVCGVLAADLGSSLFAVQRVAIESGIPLYFIYALGAICVLSIPCLLMGATMPLAAETLQRDLGYRDARLIGPLFAVNTIGSVVGTIASSGWMIAEWGCSRSLIAAVVLNLAAGVVMLSLSLRTRQQEAVTEENDDEESALNPSADALELANATDRNTERAIAEQDAADPGQQIQLGGRLENILAFAFGFCSLAYEMYLFRLIPLRHEPLPFTFAAVVTGFLIGWSAGAFLSARQKSISLSTTLRLSALAVVGTIPVFVLDTRYVVGDTSTLIYFVITRGLYFVPCIGFGFLFSSLTRIAARSWGRDVGRIAAWNTLGSCLGILATTFVGYEMPFFLMVLVIGLLLFTLQELIDGKLAGSGSNRRWAIPLTASVAVVVLPFVVDFSGMMPGLRMYSGKDGVIAVTESGDMIWDGLWHSAMSKDGNHVGSNNWKLAACPVICHPTGEIKDACVIGLATGITASTLSRLETVERVDAYDISHMLKEIHRDYPEGTLHLRDNSKINIIWQDARTGLELNDQQYDLIQAQPLYLKQSGSGLLNSREFYQLVKKRLKPNGVFCLYSNGSPEQAFVVRETARSVFPFCESFFDGYLVVLSNDPMPMDQSQIAERLASDDPLWQEIRANQETASVQEIFAILDRPSLDMGDGSLIITDDRPVVEYPHYLRREVRDRFPDLKLPKPHAVLSSGTGGLKDERASLRH